MIRGIYQFVLGILTISIRGKSIARFLNLCIRSGIVLWKVEYTDSQQLRMCIYLSDLYRLRPFLRKTHVRLQIEKRWGLPFILGKYHSRKVFAGVFLVMVLAVGMLSTKIWRIEIVGNSAIGEDTLLEYLKEQDITYGVSRADIDNDELELSLRQDFENIIWASVYEKGTKLVVSIQEKIAANRSEVTEDACMDLVASRDAEIASIITRKGTPKVVAGDKVKAGDILVCGRQEILDDNGEIKAYYYQSADADVMGYVVYDYEDWIPQTVQAVKATGEVQNRYYITVFDYRLRLPALFAEYDEYESLEEVRQLVLMDSFYLPVYFGHIQHFEQETVSVELSKDEIKSLAIEHLHQFLADLEENGVSILDKNVMIEESGDNYHIYGEISASEDITSPALTEILSEPSAVEDAEQEE